PGLWTHTSENVTNRFVTFSGSSGFASVTLIATVPVSFELPLPPSLQAAKNSEKEIKPKIVINFNAFI
ncbi:MAG: hypothetical protein WCB15_06710, partial [Desulfobacterales bacterium]